MATLIELAIGQKFKVTMNGKLMHGIVVEEASPCCCDPCMFIEKKERYLKRIKNEGCDILVIDHDTKKEIK